MSTNPHSMAAFIRQSGMALIASLATAVPVMAQDDTPDNVLIEEIIVFATKVAADVQEIPVAVTAITGEDIKDAGIKDVFDLQQNAPGLIVGQSQTSTTSNFSIRGIGTSSNNFGLESSVGLYVDGVYRSRQSSMINELIDIEAVEVLRGPQGTLFGKNTPQGAINLRTVAPGYDDPNAFVEVTGGDYGLLRISAASNFSINDQTALRATVFSSQRDGYVSEYMGSEDLLNDRDRFGARLQLAYTNNDNFDMRIIADYAEIDETCCVAVSRVDSIFAKEYTNPGSGVPGGLVPGSDFLLFGIGGTVFTADPLGPAEIGLITAVAQGLGLPANGTIVPGTPFDSYQVALNHLPHSTSEDAGLSVELNWDLDNDMTITSITGYRTFDTTDFIDADFTDTPMLTRSNDAQQKSLTQELRLSGTFGDRGQFVTGLYYYDQQLDSQKHTGTEVALAPYLGVAEPDIGLVTGGVNAISAATGGLIPPAGVAFPLDSFSNDVIEQDHQSWAVFGQVDFPIGDSLTLTLGARYTDEQKDMVGMFTHAAMGPPPDLDAIELVLCSASPACLAANPGLPPFNPFDPVTQATIAPFTFDGWGTYLFDPLAPRSDLNVSINDDQVSGTAKLTWFANDTTMFYLSYGEGYKSGGTNTDRINAAFNPVFGPETSETIELGVKADFEDINVRVNLAVYDTQVDGLQANSWTGTGFNLQNAGKADTSGWELEGWWLPTETLAFQAYWVHSDAVYEDFENGTCWDTWVFHNGQPDPNAPGGDIDAERCPRSGGTIAYNPEDTYYFSFVKDFLLSDSTSLYIRGEYSYYSEILTDGDLDPYTRLDALDLINARIGIRWEDAGSELVFWGRNLGDERYYAGSFDAPIQSGRMNSYPAEPRTWGVTYRMEF